MAFDYNIPPDTVKHLVLNAPVVKEATDVLSLIYLLMETGFADDMRDKMQDGAFDRLMARMETVLKELKGS